MNCYEILGISPTKDLKVIRKAYAKLLPLHSPETDPEGFQTLRTAYEEALKEANKEGNVLETTTPADEFMEKFIEHYQDFAKRITASCWVPLLESDLCFNLDTAKEISNRILIFIMDNYYFPHEIWLLFDQYFSWSTKKEQLYMDFPQNFIDFVIYSINNVNRSNTLRFELLLNCKNNQQDKFIAEYEKGCHALEEYDLYNTQKAINAAKEVCPEHADLLILIGRYLMTMGQMAEAEVIFADLIKQDNTDLNAYFYRGDLFFRIGKLADAYQDFQKALVIKPNSKGTLYLLGKCCICLEKYDEAVEHLKNLSEFIGLNEEVAILLQSAYSFYTDRLLTFSEANPNDITIKHKLAEAYFGANQAEKCYELLCQIEQTDAFTSEMYILLFQVLLKLNKPELAYSTICRALELFPQDFELTHGKAILLDELNQIEEAIEYYDKAIALDANMALPYNNKAYSLNKLGKFNEALECCNKALSLDANLTHAYKNKAAALLGLKLYEECFAACESALNSYPYLGETYLIKMKALKEIRQYDEALKVFNTALEFGIKDSKLYLEKGNVLCSCYEFKEASTFYDLALELDENNAEAYDCKGICYYNLDDYTEAIKCFDKAIELNPKLERAYYYKILSLMDSSQEEEALREIAQVLNLNLNDPSLFYDLKGQFYVKQAKHREAIQEYKKAIEHDPASAEYYYSVGFSLIELSSFQEALPYLDKALEFDPSMLNAYIGKSYAFLKLNEFQACIDQCNTVIELDANCLSAFQNKAWAFFELEKIDEAEESCRNALSLDANNKDQLFLKMFILDRKGLWQDALVVSDRILELEPTSQDVKILREALIEKITKINSPLGKLREVISRVFYGA